MAVSDAWCRTQTSSTVLQITTDALSLSLSPLSLSSLLSLLSLSLCPCPLFPSLYLSLYVSLSLFLSISLSLAFSLSISLSLSLSLSLVHTQSLNMTGKQALHVETLPCLFCIITAKSVFTSNPPQTTSARRRR